jgi:glyoxylase-like metal-dependent hydrolase (beta-lactamase superfamily II)
MAVVNQHKESLMNPACSGTLVAEISRSVQKQTEILVRNPILRRDLAMIVTSRISKYGAFTCAVVCLSIVLIGCQQRKEAQSVTSGPEVVIDRLVLGRFQTNCYCLRATRTAQDCLIIDTGADHVESLIDFLSKNSMRPAAVVFTHGHFDHVNGAALLARHFPKVEHLIHRNDATSLVGKAKDFKVRLIEQDGPIELAGIRLEVFHTPGHTPGGISLYCRSGEVVFTGDTLFAGSVGRSDLENGSHEELTEGIKKKLLVLPEQTVVYPGHGPSTTIGKEKRSNPFLQ